MSSRLSPPFDIAWPDAQFIEFEADFEARTVRLRLCDAEGDEVEFALGGVTKVELDQAMGFEVKRVEHRALPDGRQVLMCWDEDEDEMACVTFRTAARVLLPG